MLLKSLLLKRNNVVTRKLEVSFLCSNFITDEISARALPPGWIFRKDSSYASQNSSSKNLSPMIGPEGFSLHGFSLHLLP